MKSGGWAKVRVCDGSSEGISYILDDGSPGSLASLRAADYHELSKFGGSCGLMLSESCISVLDALSRRVVTRGGRLVRVMGAPNRTNGASDTVKNDVGVPAACEFPAVAIRQHNGALDHQAQATPSGA